MIDITQLKKTIMHSVNNAQDLSSLEEIRIKVLGKSGSLTQEMKALGKMPAEERKQMGQLLNDIRQDFQSTFQSKKSLFEEVELNKKLASEKIDVTLPATFPLIGKLHPITHSIQTIYQIFQEMGFKVVEGPDIESNLYNFTKLNIPQNHPARQMHDTFYIDSYNDVQSEEGLLLRTHTSPVQIRTMLQEDLPVRIIAPGRTYRCDSDQTHTPMFHQVEGLYIDHKENVHFGHLKRCIANFCHAFFKTSALPLRFRPSYFPFTEPSAEVDIGCSKTKDGIQVGPGLDWLEVMGCGMIHPEVLKQCDINPDEYQGFAFGMGVERLAMLKYNIPDLRTFFETDIAWLKHYGFLPFQVPHRQKEV